MKKLIFASTISILSIVFACSVAPKNGLDKNAKAFLSEFQSKLKSSDEEILALFVTNQNKSEILKAIEILQNKDTAYLRIRPIFEQATASWVDTFLKVEVPVAMQSKGGEVQKQKFFLKLFQREGRYHIGGLEADEMYKLYLLMKNENDGALARRMADAKIYYDKARELQKGYDSIVWYMHHKNMTYYFAVNGAFNFDSLQKDVKQDYKMGLLDETGKVIVPVEFELIGNPSISLPGAVEVKKNGKIGYYSMEGKQIVPAVYEWLIPYQEQDVVALVKKDSLHGWLDKDFVYHQNFPSAKAEKSIVEYSYLADNIFSLGSKYNEMIEVFYPLTQEYQYRGTGVVIAPAYLVQNDIFSAVQTEFLSYKTDTVTLRNYMGFGYDYYQAKTEKPFSISEMLGGFLSEVKSRFIGGRGEFYNHQSIHLIDKKNNLVGSIVVGKDFSFKRVDDSLYQYAYPYSEEDYWRGYFNDFHEVDFPIYGFFKYDGKKLTKLNTERRFAFTQFVKVDSSYLTGPFSFWDFKKEKTFTTYFLSNETLQKMRDEILADYGFIFPNSERAEYYKNFQWYKPITESYDEVYAKASEIDKYNLDYLDRLIGLTLTEKSM